MYKQLLIVLLAALSLESATAARDKPAARPRAVQHHSGAETLAPEVVSAVANVIGMSQLVNSTRDFCSATLPASIKRYSSAALGWQQRNAAVVAKKDNILSLSDRDLVASALNGDMLRLTEDMLRPIRQSGTAEKIKWCDKAIDDVDRGVLDLAGRVSIEPLMRYTIK